MIVVNLLLTTTVESRSVRNCLYKLVSVNDSCKPPTNYDGRIYECKKLSVHIGVSEHIYTNTTENMNSLEFLRERPFMGVMVFI